MSYSRILELSSLLATNTKLIADRLDENDTPHPSFDHQTPQTWLQNSRIAHARAAVLEATDELHALMLGPIGILTTPSHTSMISLQATCHFGLASRIPEDATGVSFTDVAKGSGLPETAVRRLLRHAMTYRVFQEPRKGFVAHTAASKYLADNSGMRDWINMVSTEMWPAATKVVEALAKWPDGEKPSHTGFNVTHDTPYTAFESFAVDSDRSNRYASAMQWFTRDPSLDPKHVVVGFNWGQLGKCTVVDVGGSRGEVSIALSRSFPDLSFVVEDTSFTVQQGQSSAPPDLRNRVTFLTHDFFTPQPVYDAEAYLLRWILHDWSDAYAVKILKALVPALKPGARVIVVEIVVPQPNTVSVFEDRKYRGFDMGMMEFHNGRERDLDEWRDLFARADPRYSFAGIQQPPGSMLSVMELVWRT